jgi:hypothetical protein
MVGALSRNQSEIQVGQVGQLSSEELPNEVLVNPHFVVASRAFPDTVMTAACDGVYPWP